MTFLNGRAFEILRAEVERCASDNPIGKTEKQIVMKRLEKLRREKGSVVTIDELHDTVFDIYPQFSQKVIKQAFKANLPNILARLRKQGREEYERAQHCCAPTMYGIRQ
jgi:hypothetical protein